MSITKKNGAPIEFVKQKKYIMVNNNLGKGSFGKTVILRDPDIDEFFVAKKYEPEQEELKEKFYQNFIEEIRILYKMNHKNIVRIYNYYIYENIYTGYILMEFINGVSIKEYLMEFEENKHRFSSVPSLNTIFIQLIDAFSYLEQKNIIHRDIREGNILIDESGMIKVIDFGIGKIMDFSNSNDSLRSQINRDVDILPLEFNDKKYTSLTDMFYLGELLNRLIREGNHSDKENFNYQAILDKMMKKDPQDRFANFAEIQRIINNQEFNLMQISPKDKQIYHSLVDGIYNSFLSFIDERKFNYSSELFVEKLQKTLDNNRFEDDIQSNVDIIQGIIRSGFKYNRQIKISVSDVKLFLKWFKSYDEEFKKIILQNIISKLSDKPVEILPEEAPF